MQGQRIVILKSTYDEALADHAPGRQLLLGVIADLFVRLPNRTVEFFTNANSDLLMWVDHSRDIVRLRLFKSASAKSLFSIAQQVQLLARSLLMARPRLRSVLPTTTQDPVTGAGSPYEVGEGSASPPGFTHDGLTLQFHRHPREFPLDVSKVMGRAQSHCLEFGGIWFTLLVDHALDISDQALFYVLRREAHVLAVLPLVLVHRADGGKRLESLSNFYTSLFTLVLHDGMQTRADELSWMLGQIRVQHKAVDRWQLGPMNPLSPAYTMLNHALQGAGLATFPYFRFGNWFVQSLPWSEYWEQRHGRLRNTVARKGKKLQALGAQIEIIQAGDRLATGIQGYQHVYAKSWKVPEPYPDFVPELLRTAAA